MLWEVTILFCSLKRENYRVPSLWEWLRDTFSSSNISTLLSQERNWNGNRGLSNRLIWNSKFSCCNKLRPTWKWLFMKIGEGSISFLNEYCFVFFFHIGTKHSQCGQQRKLERGKQKYLVIPSPQVSCIDNIVEYFFKVFLLIIWHYTCKIKS